MVDNWLARWLAVYEKWEADPDPDPAQDVAYLRQLRAIAAAGGLPCYDAANARSDYPTEFGGVATVAANYPAVDRVRTESGLWWRFDGDLLRAADPPAG